MSEPCLQGTQSGQGITRTGIQCSHDSRGGAERRIMILIKGGHVIDPGRVNGVADVLIENGKISAVGPALAVPAGGADMR